MDSFLGKRYKLKSSEKFDEYMQFIGIGFLNRKTAASVSPVYLLTRNDDGSYTLTMETAIRNSVITFKLNEEFEEERADGAKVKSFIVIDGNKLIHTQIEANGRKSTHERVFTADSLTVVKSFIVIDGNKLIQTQVEANGRKSTHERVFAADSLTVTTTAEGWPDKCVRIFALV